MSEEFVTVLSDAAFCHEHVNMLRCHDVFCWVSSDSATKKVRTPSLFGICVQKNPMGYRTIIWKTPTKRRHQPLLTWEFVGHFLRPNPWGVRTIIVHGSTTVLVSQTKSSSSYFSVREPSFASKKKMIWPDRVMKSVKLMLMGRAYKQKITKQKKKISNQQIGHVFS